MLSPRSLTMLFLNAALAASLLMTTAAGQSGRAAVASQPGAEELYAGAKSSYEAGAYQEALDKLEELLKVAPSHANALYLKYRSLMALFASAPSITPSERSSPEISREKRAAQAALLKQAAESLEKALSLKPDMQGDIVLRSQLEALQVLAEPVTRPESQRTFLFAEEVTEKAKVLRKPPPRMPERLRGNWLKSNVTVLVILGADGKVGPILVIKTESRALTEASLEAAREIKFEPATKDGRPVSTVIQIEYGFQTY